MSSVAQPSIQWQKCLGGTLEDAAHTIQQTTDGGYIVAGSTYSNDGDVTDNHGEMDVWVVKLDNAGNLQWQKCLGGSGFDTPRSIQQTSDSGYIVAGLSESNDGDVAGNHGDFDSWIVKLDNAGNLQWQKCLGGTSFDEVRSIQQSSDGGYILTGRTASTDGDVTGNQGNSDFWVVKLDYTGNLQWQKCFGGTDYEDALSIQRTLDGGYIVAGLSKSDDGDVTGFHGVYDSWIVKLNSGIGVEEINHPFSNLQFSPNPVSHSTSISFSLSYSENLSVGIYDITGRLITNLFDGRLNSGSHEIKWDVSEENGIDDGIYLVNFIGDSFSNAEKMVVVK